MKLLRLGAHKNNVFKVLSFNICIKLRHYIEVCYIYQISIYNKYKIVVRLYFLITCAVMTCILLLCNYEKSLYMHSLGNFHSGFIHTLFSRPIMCYLFNDIIFQNRIYFHARREIELEMIYITTHYL